MRGAEGGEGGTREEFMNIQEASSMVVRGGKKKQMEFTLRGFPPYY